MIWSMEIIEVYLESFIVALYLLFIFMSVQILLLLIDKNPISYDYFFRKNSILVFSLGVFFIAQQFIQGSRIIYELLHVILLVLLLLFTCKWYSKLRPFVDKQLPAELCGNLKTRMPNASFSERLKEDEQRMCRFP